MQRDRVFENYQDLEANYHQRPGYWVEPIGPWGEGRVELVELPTADETHDNVVAYWEPAAALRARPGDDPVLPDARRVARSATMHPGRQGREHLPGAAAGQRLERARATRRTAASSSISPAATSATTSAIPARCSSCRRPRRARSPTPSWCRTSTCGGFRAAIDVKLEPGQSHGPARLPARRQPGADRDLDLPLDVPNRPAPQEPASAKASTSRSSSTKARAPCSARRLALLRRRRGRVAHGAGGMQVLAHPAEADRLDRR